MPRRGRARPAGTGDDDLHADGPGDADLDGDLGPEDAFDLDGPGPTGDRSPGARPSRPVPAPRTAPDRRRVLAAVVAAAVLGALAAGGLEAHRYRTSLAEAVAVERAVGAVDAGEPGLSPASFGLSGDPVVDEDGSTALHLAVPMTNAGDTAVAVTVTGLGLTGLDAPLRVVGPAATQQLDPLEDGVALLDVGVDCAAVPADARAVLDGGAADRITATVAVGEEERAVRWAVRSSSGLVEQLVDLCHTQRGAWVEVTGLEVLQDGRVRLDVANRGAEPTSLQITTPSGGITGDPALPLLLEGDAAGSVVLTAAPDCARSEVLDDLTVSVTAGIPGDSSSEYLPGGDGPLTAWMGGRAAITCS